MKLGLNTAILDGWNYEEMIDEASRVGYECVEVACWPDGKDERRYAGVSHIDVAGLTQEKADYYVNYAKNKNIEISALAFYPNPLDSDLAKREAAISHLYKVIDASTLIGCNLVTTFIGRDQNKTVEDNITLAVEVWDPILRYAKEKGVRIAIENCPMLFSKDEWPGGKNIMTTPAIWRKMFKLLPYDNFGLNFDPSHFIWQQMDYVKAIHDFKDKIFHVHYKDIKLYRDKLDEVGVMAYPLEYMCPKLPGLGDVKWDEFVSALYSINYKGYTVVEIEDKAFEDCKERVVDSLKLAYKYLRQYVI